MPGQDDTGLTPHLESIEKMDADKRNKEMEARIKALEEQEKIWVKDRASLRDEIQIRLRQEMERAELVQQKEEKKR